MHTYRDICKMVESLGLDRKEQCKLLRRSVLALIPLTWVAVTFVAYILNPYSSEIAISIIFILIAASIALIAPVNRALYNHSGWSLRVQEAAFIHLSAPITAILILSGIALLLNSYPGNAASVPNIIIAAFIIFMSVVAEGVALHNGFSILAAYPDALERFVKLRKHLGVHGDKKKFKVETLRVELKRIDGKDCIVLYRLREDNIKDTVEIMKYTDSL